MESRATRPVAGAVAVAVVGATLAALALGLAQKSPCQNGDWSDGRQYRRLCYTDILPLFGTEHLAGGRLPYLDPCPPQEGGQCDEYPVVTMYVMRAAAWIAHGDFRGFYFANVLFLAVSALVTAWLLFRMAGRRALYFALAPTLLIYAFVNWDLLAVVLATGATFAYLRRRDGLSGILLGLGAAAKFYPALLVVPFALGRLKEDRPRAVARLLAGAAGVYAAVNLPFALGHSHAWATFFRFNAQRGADWDSLWFVACSRLHGGASCSWPARVLNPVSFVLLAGLAGLVWWARWARDPGFPRWTFGFPLVALFLLTNKVYSPQYGLWLLPWFSLALPNPWLFAAFEAADVAVFYTRFTWFGRLAADAADPAFIGFHGVPLGAFQAALLVRAAVLLVCVAAWAHRREEDTLLSPSLTNARPILTMGG